MATCCVCLSWSFRLRQVNLEAVQLSAAAPRDLAGDDRAIDARNAKTTARAPVEAEERLGETVNKT